MEPPASLDATLEAELDRLANEQLASRTWLMRGVETIGRVTEGAATTVLNLSPASLEAALENTFHQLYKLADHTDQIELIREAPLITNRAATVASGVVGGWFGVVGIVPDLVTSTTLIFDAIRKVARKHGFDTTDPEIALQCIAVFQYGEPGPDGDAAAKSFIANRLLMNGQTVSAMISRVAADFAARLTGKLGAQTVPVLGALTGAMINYAFADYYERIAEIHFRLLRLEEDNPDIDIHVAYGHALRRVQDHDSVRLTARQKLKAVTSGQRP